MKKQILRSTLYNGRVALSMDGRHIYRCKIDGGKSQFVPNATSIIGMKDKSGALMYWQRKLIGEAFRKNFPAGKTFTMNDKQLIRVEDTIKNAATDASDEAKQVGTDTHNYCEARLSNAPALMPSHPEATNACNAFENWLSGHKVEPMFLEKQLFSLRHIFCGTVDFIGKINGVLTLADFKTSKRLYNDHFMQASAYKEAFEEEFGAEIEQRAVIRFCKETGNYEFHILPDSHERDFAAFKSLQAIFHYEKETRKEIANIEKHAA